ncbi:MAG: GTP cyclohydrolase I FolE [Methylotenera sp.]|nr:GTP cyclohydrolase I FolE [Oligoflexia bacterium]
MKSKSDSKASRPTSRSTSGPVSAKDRHSDADPTIARNIASTLETLGEDIHREGLRDTPRRSAKAMSFLMSGYHTSVDQVVGKALFKADSSEIVIVRDIELYSLCEHHLLPFTGKAHVAYIPKKKIIGLSKIPRVVNMFARRLQVQERLTTQISKTLMEVLDPHGVAVIIEASHFCMMMRGVEKQNSYTITSSMLGTFRSDPTTRAELLSLLGGLGAKR